MVKCLKNQKNISHFEQLLDDANKLSKPGWITGTHKNKITTHMTRACKSWNLVAMEHEMYWIKYYNKKCFFKLLSSTRHAILHSYLYFRNLCIFGRINKVFKYDGILTIWIQFVIILSNNSSTILVVVHA